MARAGPALEVCGLYGTHHLDRKMFVDSGRRLRVEVVPPMKILGFPSQKAAKEHFKAMLARHDLGSEIKGEDAEMLMRLIALHPHAKRKVGAGVEMLYTGCVPGKAKGFWLRRVDGSTTDFSYIRCVDGERRPWSQLLSACRQAVSADLLAAKGAYFDHHGDVECAVSGESLAFDQAQIDHKPPLTFEVIVAAFLAVLGERPDSWMLRGVVSGARVGKFITHGDDSTGELVLAKEFAEYHHCVTRGMLRIVSKSVNAKLGAANRVVLAKAPVEID
jgi:hypothetical protein